MPSFSNSNLKKTLGEFLNLNLRMMAWSPQNIIPLYHILHSKCLSKTLVISRLFLQLITGFILLMEGFGEK